MSTSCTLSTSCACRTLNRMYGLLRLVTSTLTHVFFLSPRWCIQAGLCPCHGGPTNGKAPVICPLIDTCFLFYYLSRRARHERVFPLREEGPDAKRFREGGRHQEASSSHVVAGTQPPVENLV